MVILAHLQNENAHLKMNSETDKRRKEYILSE